MNPASQGGRLSGCGHILAAAGTGKAQQRTRPAFIWFCATTAIALLPPPVGFGHGLSMVFRDWSFSDWRAPLSASGMELPVVAFPTAVSTSSAYGI